jgi:pSer/pThr/pTyr-binding forkhead associated (FHA) protein
MKLSLMVLTPGTNEGKVVQATASPFLIGRDPQCHLRPASPAISKRHCALMVQGGKVFVCDLGSTNGTFLNGRQIGGEIELRHLDRLQVGPLSFLVRLETAVPAGRVLAPAQAPPVIPPVELAPVKVLLGLPGVRGAAPGAAAVDGEGIPTGGTVPFDETHGPAGANRRAGKGQPARPKG